MAEQGDRRVKDSEVADPLSEATRRGRNALLASNLFLFAVVQIGIVPKEISGFGISTGQLDPSAILLLAWILFAYFFINFSLTIGAERQAWQGKLDELREERASRRHADLVRSLEERQALQDRAHHLPKGWEADQIANHRLATEVDWANHQRVYRVRMFLDGYLPILISLVNLVACAVRLAAVR